MKRLKEEVAKETPRFRELLEKVSTVGSDQHSQSDLRHHLDDFKKLLADTRLSLIHIYQKVSLFSALAAALFYNGHNNPLTWIAVYSSIWLSDNVTLIMIMIVVGVSSGVGVGSVGRRSGPDARFRARGYHLWAMRGPFLDHCWAKLNSLPICLGGAKIN